MSFDGITLVLIITTLYLVSMTNSMIKLNKSSKKVKNYLEENSTIPLEEGMTYNSLMVYKFLYNNSGSWYTHREIAKILNISPASVVGAVTGLVKKNYAYREKVNKVSIVTISEKGINHYTRSKSGL